ncbi:MAG: NapC/NirT family cytochrome c [Gammaproteobacteria bacterium]
MHADAMLEGKTCIDCHKGIAHSVPPGSAFSRRRTPAWHKLRDSAI